MFCAFAMAAWTLIVVTIGLWGQGALTAQVATNAGGQGRGRVPFARHAASADTMATQAQGARQRVPVVQ